MKVLGLDVGQRRIGVSVGNTVTCLAAPLGAIERQSKGRDVQAVLCIAYQQQTGCIVVGIPYSLDGSLGAQGQEVMAFCESIKRKSPIPVEIWDERLSTVEAERLLREAGVKSSRDKGRRDAASAAVILQDYLDAQRKVSQ